MSSSYLLQKYNFLDNLSSEDKEFAYIMAIFVIDDSTRIKYHNIA